jgi:hypothetical protein
MCLWCAQVVTCSSRWTAVTINPQIKLCSFRKRVYATSRLTRHGFSVGVPGFLNRRRFRFEWRSFFSGFTLNAAFTVMKTAFLCSLGAQDEMTWRETGSWRDWASMSIVQGKFYLPGREGGALYSLHCAACRSANGRRCCLMSKLVFVSL